MQAGRPRTDRTAECHQERNHYAKGLCRPCYVVYRRVKTGGVATGRPTSRQVFKAGLLKAQGGSCKACDEGIDPYDPNQFSVYWGTGDKPLGAVCARCRSLLGFLEGTKPSVLWHVLELLNIPLPAAAQDNDAIAISVLKDNSPVAFAGDEIA